jgi:hypothetical protein
MSCARYIARMGDECIEVFSIKTWMKETTRNTLKINNNNIKRDRKKIYVGLDSCDPR